MAQNYMLLHQKRDELANTQSITHLKNGEYTVTGALKIIEGKKYRTAEKEKMAELDQAVKEYLDKSKLFRYTINQGIETLRDGKFTESDRAFTINRNILLINQLQEFNGLLGAEVIDE